MKLVVMVVSNQNAPMLVEELVDKGIRVTRLVSSGGFFRWGNTTLLSGVEDDEIPLVLQIVNDFVQKKKLEKIEKADKDQDISNRQKKSIYTEGMATIFILPIEKVIRF